MIVPAPAIDRESVAGVCREFGLDLLLLHGSQATGHVHSTSDVDVGYVRGGEALSLRRWQELAGRLEPLLPEGQIDLVDLRRVPGLLRHLACERGRLLYEARAGAFNEFRVLSWNIYQDERIQLRRHDADGLRRALEAIRA